jgi:hypothetical protein
MVRNPEASFSSYSLVDLLINWLIYIKDASTLFTPEVVVIRRIAIKLTGRAPQIYPYNFPAFP